MLQPLNVHVENELNTECCIVKSLKSILKDNAFNIPHIGVLYQLRVVFKSQDDVYKFKACIKSWDINVYDFNLDSLEHVTGLMYNVHMKSLIPLLILRMTVFNLIISRECKIVDVVGTFCYFNSKSTIHKHLRSHTTIMIGDNKYVIANPGHLGMLCKSDGLPAHYCEHCISIMIV